MSKFFFYIINSVRDMPERIERYFRLSWAKANNCATFSHHFTVYSYSTINIHYTVCKYGRWKLYLLKAVFLNSFQILGSPDDGNNGFLNTQSFIVSCLYFTYYFPCCTFRILLFVFHSLFNSLNIIILFPFCTSSILFLLVLHSYNFLFVISLFFSSLYFIYPFLLVIVFHRFPFCANSCLFCTLFILFLFLPYSFIP